jgi:hypothetical protein
MKAYLELELRGDGIREMSKLYKYLGNEAAPGLGTALFSFPPSAWVAEITGPDSKYKYQRKFLRLKKDYSRSNSKGSRGVYAEYILDSGRLYEVKDFKNRYFCTVSDDGDIIKLNESEVQEWLKNHLV